VTRNKKEPEPSATRGEQHDDRPEQYPHGAAAPEFPDGDWADFVAARARFLRSRGMDCGDEPDNRRAQQQRSMYRSVRTRFFV